MEYESCNVAILAHVGQIYHVQIDNLQRDHLQMYHLDPKLPLCYVVHDLPIRRYELL